MEEAEGHSQGDSKHLLSQALPEGETQFFALLDGLHVGVIVCDQRGEVLALNQAACDLLGSTEAQLVGTITHHWRVFDANGALLSYANRPLPRVLVTRQPLHNAIIGMDRADTGERIWLLCHFYPLLTPTGDIDRILATATDITALVRVEEALRRREEDAYRFQEQLKALHEAGLVLAQSDSLDTLYRRAIELGLSHLKFDRLSLWLLEDGQETMLGTYGTDETGRLRDERGHRLPLDAGRREVVFVNRAVSVQHDWPLYNSQGEIVGRGWHAVAPLRDGDRVIGMLCADNFLHGQCLKEYEAELLGLYGVTVGHLCARIQREEAQRETETRFQALFASAAIGIALVDPQGHPVVSNRALREMLGYSEEELRSMAFTAFTHPEDVALDWRLYQELAEGKRDYYQIEKRYIRKDGSMIWGRLTVSLVRDANGAPRFGIGMAENITERKHAEQNLQDSLARLHTLTSHLQSVREEERTRVAREVHDELGQALTSLKIELAWLKRQTLQSVEAVAAEALLEKMASMNGLLEATIKTVRRISTELRPAVLDTFGLIPALEWQAQDFQNRTGITCQFSSNMETAPLDTERMTAVFRIVQESLTNVLRHAKATRTQVRLERCGGTLTLTVRDNGVGIEKAALTGAQSFGLLGMRERAHLLGGEIQLVGAPKRGTTVTLRLPMQSST